MKRIIQWATAVVLGVCGARADFIVAPNDRETQNGSSLLIPGFQAPGGFQVVYTSRNFSGPVEITGIAFRQNEGAGGLSFETVIPRITIRLTTYSRTVDSFDRNSYANNKGIDDTLVFDSGVTWRTTDLPGSVPNPFDLAIAFSQPFTYDPSRGALLMSYSVPDDPGGNMAADYHERAGAPDGWMGVPGSFGGTFVGFPVTRFQVTPIPEPSAATYLITTGVAVLSRRMR